MGAVIDFVGDVFEGVGDIFEAVGDVVESVADAVVDVVEFVGDAVQAIIEDPLPMLLQIAGAAVGIPPWVTSAVVTGARGGDLGDMVLSAGTSYLAPMVVGPIAGSLSETFVDAGVNSTVASVVSNSIGSGLVAGTVAEIKGGEFIDGFAGGVTGGLVTGGVTALTNIVSDTFLTTATDAVNSVGTTANADFTAGFDSGATVTSGGMNVGESVSLTVDGFDNVVGRSTTIAGDATGTTGAITSIDLSTNGSGITADVVSDVTVSNIGVDNTGVDSTFTGDTSTVTDTTGTTNVVDTTFNNTDTTTGSNLTSVDTGSTSDVADVTLNSGNTTDSNFVGDSGGLDSVADILESLDTDTSDTSINTSVDTAADTTTGGLSTLNTELTGGSDIVSADTDIGNVDLTDDVVGGLTAVSGDQGDAIVGDDLVTVATDAAGNDVVVRAGDVVADTVDTTGADTVGGLTQVQTGNNNLNVDSAADATTGGLNQASNIGAKDDAFGKIIKGAVTRAVTGAVKKGISGGINKALGVGATKRPTATKQFVGNVAPKVATKVAPKSIDISKLRPMTTAKKTAPLKANVSNLTPVSKISGLSTLVNRKG